LERLHKKKFLAASMFLKGSDWLKVAWKAAAVVIKLFR
jgi:hypothetical protein